MIPFNLPHNPKPPRPRQSRTPFGAGWPRIIIFVMYDVLYLIRDPLIAFIIQHSPPLLSIVPSSPLAPLIKRESRERQRLLELIAVPRPAPPFTPSPSLGSISIPGSDSNRFERSTRSFISFKRQLRLKLSPRCKTINQR